MTIYRPATSPDLLTFDPASDALLPVIGWHTICGPGTDLLVSDTAYDGFPVTNLSNPATHLFWFSAAEVTDEYIYCFNDNGETLSYLALANHGFSGLTLTVEAATVGSPSDYFPITESVVVDSGVIIFQFDPITPRAVRLHIEGDGTQFAYCAVMYVGLLMTLERGVRVDTNHMLLSGARMSNIVNGTSESGQFVGRLVRNQWKETKYEFMYFTRDFYEDHMNGFVTNSVDNPFFIAAFPDEITYDVGYVWLTKDPIPELHPPTRRVNLTLEVRGLIE